MPASENLCFAAEDDLPPAKTEAEPPNDNNATPPKSPTPEASPATTPTAKTSAAPVEVNGTSPERKPSPEPPKTTPEPPASEHINNAKSNSKHVEELYDIPVGKCLHGL